MRLRPREHQQAGGEHRGDDGRPPAGAPPVEQAHGGGHSDRVDRDHAARVDEHERLQLDPGHGRARSRRGTTAPASASARRGTPPAARPSRRPSAAGRRCPRATPPSLAKADKVGVQHADRHDPRDHAHRDPVRLPGGRSSTSSSSGTARRRARSAEPGDRYDLQDQVADPSTTSAIAVARGMVRRGSRNSPARWVPASQPANAQTYRLLAAPDAGPPVRYERHEVLRLGRGHDERDHARRPRREAPR